MSVNETTATCKYCGQVVMIDGAIIDPDEREQQAILNCGCDQAVKHQHEMETEEERKKKLTSANEKIKDLFKEEGEEITSLLYRLTNMCINYEIMNATVKIGGRTKAKISNTSKGKVRIDRIDTLANRREV